MRIALLQATGTPADHAANLAAIDDAARTAAAGGARLLITPEAFLSGYDIGADRLRELASADPPPQLGATAAAHGIAIVTGWPERAGEEVFNSAVLIDREGVERLRCRKTHLYGEVDREAFAAGDRLSEVVELDGVQIALCICFDVEYPETVRALALAGADLIAVPTSLMAPYDVVAHTLVPARAAENQVFVAYANRIGRERAFDYIGYSCVAGPGGEVLARAPREEPALLLADVDPGAIRSARAQFDYLTERRPALYGRLGT